MLEAWSSILGPNLAQCLLIRLSSNSSVDHWATLQFLTFNVTVLVKQHHIFFGKILSKPVESFADRGPMFTGAHA